MIKSSFNNCDQKTKDNIINAIYEELERLDWGGHYDKIVLRIPFKGRFNLQQIEADLKSKRRVL